MISTCPSAGRATGPSPLRPALVVPVVLLVASIGVAVAADPLDSPTAARGLKEALQVGTAKAVDLLGTTDGYLGNPEVRIPVPDDIDKVTDLMKRLGREELVDEFETGMNRAAESAAPLAKEVFVETIRSISFEDAIAIVKGSDTAATDYLRKNAGPVLSERFRPIVDERLDAVGATREFDQLMQATKSVPFFKQPAFDLGGYVTDRALDGMFKMIATEEARIRKDPVARTTDLLKQVFGGSGDKQKKKSFWDRLRNRD